MRHSHIKSVAVLRKLLDRIATVQELPLISINVRDLGVLLRKEKLCQHGATTPGARRARLLMCRSAPTFDAQLAVLENPGS